MFRRVESWLYSSYLQIRFIESILNTAGAAKSSIYHKQLISSGSEGLELAFRAPVLVASFAVQAHPGRLMPRLCQWTIQTCFCCSSRCHLLGADCAVRMQIAWDWVTVSGCRWGAGWRVETWDLFCRKNKMIQRDIGSFFLVDLIGCSRWTMTEIEMHPRKHMKKILHLHKTGKKARKYKKTKGIRVLLISFRSLKNVFKIVNLTIKKSK